MAVGYRGGLITGKIGGDVGYMVKNAKGRVSQGWRAYQAHVSNPNNYAQRYNRVLLSTMARAYSVLRPICDHSFEGVSGASRNQKEFAKVNMPILQDIARNGNGNFNEKGNFNGVVNQYVLSKGSLPRLEYSLLGSGANRVMSITLPSALQREVSEITLGDLFDVMGWDDGGQITICWVENDGGADIQLFRFARFVFRLGAMVNTADGTAVAERDTPLLVSRTAGEEVYYEFAVDPVESVGVGLIRVRPNQDGGFVSGFSFSGFVSAGSGAIIPAYAAISSALIGNTWKRSTQAFNVLNDSDDGYELDRAIASYATTKDSSLYLNH